MRSSARAAAAAEDLFALTAFLFLDHLLRWRSGARLAWLAFWALWLTTRASPSALTPALEAAARASPRLARVVVAIRLERAVRRRLALALLLATLLPRPLVEALASAGAHFWLACDRRQLFSPTTGAHKSHLAFVALVEYVALFLAHASARRRGCHETASHDPDVRLAGGSFITVPNSSRAARCGPVFDFWICAPAAIVPAGLHSLSRPRRFGGVGRALPTFGTVSMAEEQPLDRIVLRYLQKRGFKDAEKALKSEAKIPAVSQMALVPHLGADASIADHILYYNEVECEPAALVEGYRLLREWVHGSLDLYKVRTSAAIETRDVSARFVPRGNEQP